MVENDPDGRTYEDFELNQKVVCTGTLEEFGDFFIDPGYQLTTGRTYKITDLDFHFPNKICVNNDKVRGGFYPINLFDSLKGLRNKKIDEILNDK